jgi:uncharacterized cofD-like protein
MVQVDNELQLQEVQIEKPRNVLSPRLQRPTRIVCMGGGTGLPVILKGLSRKAEKRAGDPGLDLTAVVAMADDGGSSGRLRRARGVLPPGDIRNCLVALSGNTTTALRELFQYRFDGGKKGLGGHSVGNLVIAALAELKGDFLEAVRLSAKLLGTRGTVLPSTLAPVQLVAHLDDDTRVVGERNLCRARGRIQRVSLSPAAPPPVDGIIEAIHEADLITIGPGSLFSSVLPNLLVDGVAQALRETRALKVLVSNLMTQPGETDGMSAEDHVRSVLTHVGPVIDVVLQNGKDPSREQLERYREKGSIPLRAERRALIDMGVIPVEADLLKNGSQVRHDSAKLARVLLKLARSGL